MRVFEIRYRDAAEVSLLIQPALGPSVLTVNRELRTITVVDRPDVVAKVADFIRQFDVPPHAVVVRIVLEKAQRDTADAVRRDLAGAEAAFRDVSAWRYVQLAEATLEVLERGHATQALGPDGTFEVHVHLDSVDPQPRLIRFDELALDRREASRAVAGGSAPPARRVFSTAIELQDRVGKVVMAARDPASDEALVVRVIGLIRERPEESR